MNVKEVTVPPSQASLSTLGIRSPSGHNTDPVTNAASKRKSCQEDDEDDSELEHVRVRVRVDDEEPYSLNIGSQLNEEQLPLDDVTETLISNQRYKNMTWGRLLEVEIVNGISQWWKFFYKWEQTTGKAAEWPKCKGCMQNFTIGSNRSTGPLKTHATRCKEIKKNPIYCVWLNELILPSEQSKSLSLNPSSNSGSQKTISQFGFNIDEKYKRAAVEFIVTEYLPLDLLQRRSFRKMMVTANPKCLVIGKDCVNFELLRQDAVRIACLKNDLKGVTYALTHDAWTSIQKIGYIAITIHFVNKDWKLVCLPLACTAADLDPEEEGSHKAEVIVQLLKQVLDNYDLEITNCVGFTTDTASVMQKCSRIFINMGRDLGAHMIFNPCAAHTLELTAKLVGKENNAPLSENAIVKAKKLVRLFRKSTNLTLALSNAKDTVHSLKDKKFTALIQDVSTRWWATWQMIDRLIAMKPALDILLSQEKLTHDQYLCDTEWQLLRMIEETLKPFKIFQKLLEGEKYLTISLMPFCIAQIRRTLELSCEYVGYNQNYRELCEILLSDFENRWGSGIDGTVYNENIQEGISRAKGLSLAALWGSVLDPRTMNYLNIYGPSDKALLINGAKKEAVRLYLLSNQLQGETVESIVPQQQGAEIFNLDWLGIEQPEVQGITGSELDTAVNLEYANLLREQALPLPRDGVPHADPLEWWRQRETKFPILVKLAKRILIIPATSAPSERVFSNAGITISNDRANLLPEKAEMLILMHDYYKYKNSNEAE